MNNSNQHFNDSAKKWDTPEKIQKSAAFSVKIKNALAQIAPDFNISGVLEIGCGTGLLGSHFLNSHSYLGVDSSDEMLKVLKNKFPQQSVQTLNTDIENSTLTHHPYDFVLSQMAFHHLKNPADVICNLKKDKTIFAIIDLDQEDGTFHPDPKGMGVFHFGFSQNEIQTWSEKSGLKLLHYEIINVIEKNDKKYQQFLAILG